MEFLTPTAIGIILIALVVVVYWITTFIIFYHLIRFGIGTQPKQIAFVYLMGAAALFFLCAVLLLNVNWVQTVESLGELLGKFVNTTYLQ